jgi:glycosyltransferase involved in cell wall biosynthesis
MTTTTPVPLPMVSVCTPTFNRRPFVQAMIQCFDHQTYPRERMEWVIIDDGTDPIEDLVAHHPCVKYFRLDDKVSLGKKRNMMHKKARGDILVYMDDDDYYPPERVSHAVETLLDHKTRKTGIKLVGSSEMHIYFKEPQARMVQFGPYGPNHATAATFAFWKELLSESKLKYDESACVAEERAFLHGYTIPMAQLDPMKVILVFSHDHNTFDKRMLLANLHRTDIDPNMRVSAKTPTDFIKEPELLRFYMHDIDAALVSYEPGHPSMKPDVLQQIREKMQKQQQQHQQQQHQQQQHQQQQQQQQQQHQQQQQQQQHAILKTVITFKAPNAENRSMTVEELIQTVQVQAEKLEKMRELCNKKIRENSDLLSTIKDRDEVITAHLETIERQSAIIDHDCNLI